MTISGNNAEETLVGRIIQRIYILEKITRIDYIRWGIRRVWFCCKDVLEKKRNFKMVAGSLVQVTRQPQMRPYIFFWGTGKQAS